MSSLAKGDAFWLKAAEEDRQHIHVILSDPSISPDIVLVPITSVYDSQRSYACEFTPAEHPRITKHSHADYRQAKMFTAGELTTHLAAGRIKKIQPFPQDKIERMWAGAGKDANFIPRGCRSILFSQGLLQ